MIVFAIYSVSQIRITEEFARRIPTGERFIFLSFNDAPSVNQRLNVVAASLNTSLVVLDHLASSVPPTVLNRELEQIAASDLSEETSLNESYCKLLARQKAACRSFILENNVSAVVVCEDGPGGCAPLIAVAKNIGIPVIDMPFGIGEMRDYEMFLDNRAAENALNLVPDGTIGAAVRRYAAHWILKTRFGDLTLFPADFVLARIATGLDLPKPWVVHGGNADVLCVESEAMERIYRREGVDAAKCLMTGSCYADAVYDEIQTDPAFLHAYQTCNLIEPSSARILIALPPSYHAERRAEFPTYEETVQRLLEGCRSAHPNTILTISLHPAADQRAIDIVKKYADIVSEDWLLRLIARNDVFVPTFSSTIRWALMARKPIVNYDLYRFNLPTYDSAPMVFTTPVLEEAHDRLLQILQSPASYHAAAASVSSIADEWGIMDGQNFSRIWQQIETYRAVKARNEKPSLFNLFFNRIRNLIERQR